MAEIYQFLYVTANILPLYDWRQKKRLIFS